MKRYTLTIDTGKPYSEDYNTIEEIKTAVEQFENDFNYNDFPYCDIQIFDNQTKQILNTDEVLR